MTEFIKQLRAHECEGQFASDCCKDICGEAADEIERLTAEVSQLNADSSVLLTAIAEIAAQKLAKEMEMPNHADYHFAYEEMIRVARTASDTLSGNPTPEVTLNGKEICIDCGEYEYECACPDLAAADSSPTPSVGIDQLNKYRDLVFKYIDRMNDPAECDLLHDIVAEYSTEFERIRERLPCDDSNQEHEPWDSVVGPDEECITCGGVEYPWTCPECHHQYTRTVEKGQATND